MQEKKFNTWIQENKRSITKPEKYSKTIITISNDLKSKLGYDVNLYDLSNAEESLSFYSKYFSYDEFYTKNKIGNRMYSRAFELYTEFLEVNKDNSNIASNEIERITSDQSLKERERESIILSRLGQGQFRKDLIKLWDGCAISGFNDERFLIASHIKPWKKSDNSEKIDKFNGFLLLPTYDKLFDLGFISFDNDGEIKISNKLNCCEKLGIRRGLRIEIKIGNQKYLEYHRENIFKK